MNNLKSSGSHGLSRRDAIRQIGVTGAATSAAMAVPNLARATRLDGAATSQKAVVDRLFAALNGGDLDQMDAFIAVDHVFHTCGRDEPIVGRGALKALLSNVRTVESSVPYTLEGIVADADQVAARWSRQGTAIDPETGLPTSGTTIVEGQFICRIRNGQLIETWNVSFARDITEINRES